MNSVIPAATLSTARRVEFWILAGLVFSLPLFEAPKNILWGLYLVAWCVNRACERDFGGRWDVWDTLIAAWIASGFLVAAFAGVHHDEWYGAVDLLRYGSILWCLKRSRYDERQLRVLFLVLFASTAIGLAHGYWRLYVTGARRALELKSVGHVNHSAIYLAIATGLLTSVILTYWRKLSVAWRTTLVSGTALFLVSEFVMQSRVAVGAVLALIVLIALVWMPRAPRMGVRLLIVMAGVVVAAVALKAGVVLKQEQLSEQGNILSFRMQIWNTALLAWRQYPVWGLGMGNYSVVKPEVVSNWLVQRGEPPGREEYFPSSGHAHSLYLNTLAERGAAGVIALGAILLLWLYTLIRSRPRVGDPDCVWALWGGALSAWFITVGVGVFNTTLHHEHALLATMLLGLWLADRTRRDAARTAPQSAGREAVGKGASPSVSRL